MNKITKKEWFFIVFLFLLNLPLLITGLWFTNKSVTLKGDISPVNESIEVEGDYSTSGTFSTIYVISFDHSTILQNILCSLSKTSDVSDLPPSYLHFTPTELYQMGVIQYESSIMTTIISSYQLAKAESQSVNLDYQFRSLAISFYLENSGYMIGDEIIAINDVYGNIDFASFRELFNNRKPGDSLTINRSGNIFKVVLTKENINAFGFYPYYDIDYNTIVPKIEIAKGYTTGPSGGLMRSLALYNSLVEFDYSLGLNIAGTGTIDIAGNVGAIGGVKQKIYTAFSNNVDIFLCPSDNYDEALEAYNSLPNKEKMQIFSIDSLEEALEVLKNV